VSHLLDHLPDSLRDAPKMRVFAPPTPKKWPNNSKPGAALPTQ
jgi:hypothetical protein